MRPVRVALVGAGGRAREQALAMLECPDVELVAYVNRSGSSVPALGAADSYSTVRDMVTASRPDLVSIVTPPAARFDVIDEALSAGAGALLVEKPVAASRDELERIVGRVGSAFVAVNTQHPWTPQWRHLRERIAAGAVGQLRSITATTRMGLVGQGPHLLSIAHALSGELGAGPVPRMLLAGRLDEESPSVAAVLDLREELSLRILGGPIAPRTPGENDPLYHQQVEVVGTSGTAWLSLNRGWKLWSEDGYVSGPTNWRVDDIAAQSLFLAEVAAAIRNPGLRDTFPTRLSVAAAQMRLLFTIVDEAGR